MVPKQVWLAKCKNYASHIQSTFSQDVFLIPPPAFQLNVPDWLFWLPSL